MPPITEDSMPGELSNVIAGRVANAFDLRGPNFTTDAACAGSIAALQTACKGLLDGDFDMAITGGGQVLPVMRSAEPERQRRLSRIRSSGGGLRDGS